MRGHVFEDSVTRSMTMRVLKFLFFDDLFGDIAAHQNNGLGPVGRDMMGCVDLVPEQRSVATLVAV